jgi:hypothetical protein
LGFADLPGRPENKVLATAAASGDANLPHP